MIIRRFTDHVRDQNWFAVTLDVVVVVVGIFLGLSATEWYEDRKAADEERAALERLHSEAVAIIENLQGAVRRYDNNLAAMEVAVRAFEAGTLEGADRDRFRQGVLTVIYFDALAPPRTVYDELTSSGRFGELSSTEVRERVADYYAQLRWFDGQVDFYRRSAEASIEAAGTAIRRYFAPDSQLRRIKYRVDFDQLATNETYLNEFLRSYSNQYVFQRSRRWILRGADRMCAALAAETNRACPEVAQSQSNSDNNGSGT